MGRVTNEQRREGRWCWWRKDDVMVGTMQKNIGAALKEGKDEIGYRKNKNEIEKERLM